ncbi:uncharacterized protein LOC102080458 [Oreochromis niloticus]|uniref:uncharacterized protein LOC102080458 n=1 Tax=Oreochromis niloticus TaxID=8128 RepID=UPI0009056EF6|nr:uncharacterized protein LOC102080458 [Oreochromis niloticus]
MSPKKHNKREIVKPSAPLCDQEDNIQVQKMCLEEMDEKNLRENHNTRHPPQPEYIYYVWQSFFEQRAEIMCLREEYERRTAEVHRLFSQLVEKEDIQKEKEMEVLDMRGRIFELQAKLNKAQEKPTEEVLQQKKNEQDKDKKIQELQVKLDEALQKNKEILQEKKQLVIKLQGTEINHKVLKGRVEFLQKKGQQTMKQEDTDCKLQDMEKHNKGLQIKLDEALQKNKELLQEKEQMDVKQRKLQGMEEKYKALQARHDKTLNKNKELLQEKSNKKLNRKKWTASLKTWRKNTQR